MLSVSFLGQKLTLWARGTLWRYVPSVSWQPWTPTPVLAALDTNSEPTTTISNTRLLSSLHQPGHVGQLGAVVGAGQGDTAVQEQNSMVKKEEQSNNSMCYGI